MAKRTAKTAGASVAPTAAALVAAACALLHCDPDALIWGARTVQHDRSSFHNTSFRWPAAPTDGSGVLVRPQRWDPRPVCGDGLHFSAYGAQPTIFAHNDPSVVWQLVAARRVECVDVEGDKYKAPVVALMVDGDRATVAVLVVDLAPAGTLVGLQQVAKGDRAAIALGAYSSLAGGAYSSLAGGAYSSLAGGAGSSLAGGAYSSLAGGAYSSLAGGAYSSLAGGAYSSLAGGAYSSLAGGAYSSLAGGAYSSLAGGAGSSLAGGADSSLAGGAYSSLAGGAGSSLAGGADSSLAGGAYSSLAGGADSSLAGGAGSSLAGGAGSRAVACDGSVISWVWWDGKRYRGVQREVGTEPGMLVPDQWYECVWNTGEVRPCNPPFGWTKSADGEWRPALRIPVAPTPPTIVPPTPPVTPVVGGANG